MMEATRRFSGPTKKSVEAGGAVRRDAWRRLLAVAMLAENSTLKAALDIYQSEMATSKHTNKYELVSTVTRELEKIAARVRPDILAVTDASGRTVAAAGRLKAAWPDSMPSSDEGSSRFVSLGAGAYRLASTRASSALCRGQQR